MLGGAPAGTPRTFPERHLYLREDLTANLLERLRQGRLEASIITVAAEPATA